MHTIVEAMNLYLDMIQKRTRPVNADLVPAKRNKKRRAPGKKAPFETIELNKPTEAETPTTRSYRYGLQTFAGSMLRMGSDPRETPVDRIQVDWIKSLIAHHPRAKRSTMKLYLAAASNFFHFLAAENLADVNLARLKQLIADRSRKLDRQVTKFPRDAIEQLIQYAETLPQKDVEPAAAGLKTATGQESARRRERLRNLRDRAFILVLADAGLRCSEACALTRADINALDHKLDVIGKGGDEALVFVSDRALKAIREYLELRDHYQPPDSKLVKSLPLFVRHDRGAGELSLNGIASATGWEIVKARAKEILSPEAVEQIHPHSFRHYFVTIILLATNNIEKARKMARHKSIATTQLYAEVDSELEKDYDEIFNTGNKNGYPA